MEPHMKENNHSLIWRFLRGSRGFFVLCMVCAAVSALADMVTPQIIRVAIDQVIGGAPADTLSPAVQRRLYAFCGTEGRPGRLWCTALAVGSG